MNKKIAVLDKGYVLMVDHMGDDQRIVDSARVSFGKGTTTKRNAEGLINYLMSHDHSSPFEQVTFTFEVKVPLFIARQWLRHRTLSANEVSARYSEVEDEFYIPTQWREQDTVNKQGSINTNFDDPEWHRLQRVFLESWSAGAHQSYKQQLDDGVAREMARMVLPQNVYTSFVFTQNLHNLLHFLRLRLHPHAQYEIRVYAEAILELIEPVVPLAVKAWREHVYGAVRLSATEKKILLKAFVLWRERPAYDALEDIETLAVEAGMSESRVREFLAKLGERV